MQFSLPDPVKQLLKNPAITLLGHGWANHDELKMKTSFRMGAAHFVRLLDLQHVCVLVVQ
jgi:hypothetical protein